MQAPADLVGFHERERPRLVGALSLYCGDAALAEELADEAIVRACERWHDVARMDAPGAWVHRVAINLANSHFRRRRAERRARQRAGSAPEAEHAPDTGDAVAIRGAVSALPARQREAIVLRFYLQLTVSEVAREMGVSETAVKSLTHRAIQTLRVRFPVDERSPQEVDDAAS